jgi:hypothetical protein
VAVAADLTADVFLAVIESAAGYPPVRGSQIGWLFGVARNVIADEGASGGPAGAGDRPPGRAGRDLDADDIASRSGSTPSRLPAVSIGRRARLSRGWRLAGALGLAVALTVVAWRPRR